VKKKALIEGTCDDWIECQIMDPKKRREYVWERGCGGVFKNFKFFYLLKLNMVCMF